MDYLLDLEIVGSKLSMFGDKNEILSIFIEHDNIVKCICIACGKKDYLNL